MSTENFFKGGVEFSGLEGTKPLSDALHVSGPYKVQNAPNAYSFERYNSVPVDWNLVLKATEITMEKANSRQLKRHIQSSWKDHSVSPPELLISANTFDLSADWPAYIHDGQSVVNSIAKGNAHVTIFKGQLQDYRLVPHATGTIAIKSGCVFCMNTLTGPRWYQPVIHTPGSLPTYPLTMDFLADRWNETWDEITALVQVYFPGAKSADPGEQTIARDLAEMAAKSSFPAVELIRADAATISNQYRNLMHDAELSRKLAEKATDIASTIPTAPFEVIPTLTSQFRELKNFATDLDTKKRQLADAASDLNYHLFIADTDITGYEDGTGNAVLIKLKEGTLYLKSNRTISWTTYQTVTRSNSGFFGIGASSSSWQVPTHHSKSFDYYEPAIVDHDPWVEILEFYKSKGFFTYLFRYTDRGLEASDGSTPDHILNLCESDENFRLKCVVALPKKEVTLIGQSFVIGYYLFIRPVPDIVATSFPEICIKERLSYRFTWTGVALGDLAATIPLSPGEQRDVSLTTSQKYTSTRSETASSLIDITRIDRADFETVFEKEVRKENESSSTSSASVGGSYAGFSGSASFSRTDTTKDVARQLNRSVQRASQEVNRRSKEERTVTVTESIESSQQNTTSFKVRNINDGSTLNIAFYRLYNAFQSVLKLDDYLYSAKAGRSIFAAIDLVDEALFGRDKLDDLIRWLQQESRFPQDIRNLTDDQFLKFKAALLSQILEAYKKYPDPPPEDPGTNSFMAVTTAFARDGDAVDSRTKKISIAQEYLAEITEIDDGVALVPDATPDLSTLWNQALGIKNLVDDDLIGIPFWKEQTEFAYDSGSLYADVYVGQRPATEPYAENMRRLEELRVEGENRILNAKSRLLDSRAAKQLIGLGGILDKDKVFVTNRDVLYLEDGHVEVRLLIVPVLLASGGWSLVIKTTAGFDGGRFIQRDNDTHGVLSFILPRRFNGADLNLGAKDEEWFKVNVSVLHLDMALSVPYKK